MKKAVQNVAPSPGRRWRTHKHVEVRQPGGDWALFHRWLKCSVTHSAAKLDAKTKLTASG